MSDLYKVIGKSEMKNLLADPQDADLIAIPCTPGSGVVKAGTVMFREGNGMYSPASGDKVKAENMLAVLKEDVDTGGKPESGMEAVAEDAAAYRRGRFIDGAVKLAEDAELGAAHKAALRQQGIVFGVKESASTFDNKLTGTD